MEDFEVFYLATDPVIAYTPAVDADGDNTGWRTEFSGDLIPAQFGPRGDQQGVGAPWRTTSHAGSSFKLDFYGTSVVLHGDYRDVAWVVRVDELRYEHTFFTGKPGCLLELRGMKRKWHQLEINVNEIENSGWLRFDRVQFKTGYKVLQQYSVKCTDINNWDMVLGNWQQGAIPCIRDQTKRINVVTSTLGNAVVKVNMTRLKTQKSPTFLFLYGNLHSERGKYAVFGHNCRSNALSQWQKGTAQSKYVVQRALLWFGVRERPQDVSVPWSTDDCVELKSRDECKIDFLGLDYCSPSGSGWLMRSPVGTRTRKLSDYIALPSITEGENAPPERDDDSATVSSWARRVASTSHPYD
ncbi:hypothetical protein BKA62DRAFT_761240, partial [Auriculariales sp. MPI-PUGE-AT-0066]